MNCQILTPINYKFRTKNNGLQCVEYRALNSTN